MNRQLNGEKGYMAGAIVIVALLGIIASTAGVLAWGNGGSYGYAYGYDYQPSQPSASVRPCEWYGYGYAPNGNAIVQVKILKGAKSVANGKQIRLKATAYTNCGQEIKNSSFFGWMAEGGSLVENGTTAIYTAGPQDGVFPVTAYFLGPNAINNAFAVTTIDVK